MRVFVIFFLIICFGLFLPSVKAQQLGNNSNVIRLYVSPDKYYPIGKVYKLEKLDINKASLEQLMALPEINEDLALKIMRKRPISNLKDLSRLPYINMDRMELILKGIQNLVVQPLEEKKNDLKQ